MSLKNNTTSLQKILDMVNTLPDSSEIPPNVQRAAGTFTPVFYNERSGYSSVDCGFEPDIVYITEGYSYDDAEGSFVFVSAAFAFTEGNVDYMNSVMYDEDDLGTIAMYVMRNSTGFEIWVGLDDWSWNYSPYTKDLNYVAVKYTNTKNTTEGIQLPTLTNEGTSEDLLEGKQLIDSNGSVVFGSLTPSVSSAKVKTTTPSSNSRSISFTELSEQPKMFSIVPQGNTTLSSSTRYAINVVYDGTTTRGVYSNTSSASHTTNGFTWTYSNGTLTVNTASTTNGGYFRSGVAYQLTYI